MKERKKYNVGDVVVGRGNGGLVGGFHYVYEVIAVEEKERFGSPDQLLTVRVTTTNPNSKFVETSKRWSGQLF
jgi:hypothetical protein